MIVRPELPSIDNDEYAEWVDVLDAVCTAGERFAMVELGAGWGRWLVNGAFAHRQLHADGELRLVAVEADPTHFRWLGEHLERNRVDAHSIEAAVAGAPGQVMFDVGDPVACYGQRIVSTATWRDRLRGRSDRRAVRAITLAQALEPIGGTVDLVDLDVEGVEADVLTAGASELRRVRCVHIGTHTVEQETRLRTLFTGLGWECRSDYPCYSTTAETWWGARNLALENGVQSWLNPAYARP